jgi:ATP-dependent DNA helicase RecQ
MAEAQSTEIKKTLKEFFGYEDFRFSQEAIINSIISGENVLAILPTGAGKSLCYQIPALLSEKYSIVISPLVSLMKDQVDELSRKNIPSVFINSETDINSYYSIRTSLAENKIKLLYVSPERLANNYFHELIEGNPPEYLFVDEAHCISQWGHNFRPSYKRIKNFCQSFGIKKISAFTASAIPEVVDDITKQLGFTSPRIFIGGFERKNISVSVIFTKDKKSKLLKILADDSEATIVYSATRKSAEEISNFLNLNKIKTSFYHGGMNSLRRQQVQDEFLEDKIRVISATNAFGMGINKSNIRIVIHYNMPATIESYYQEIGRAGRDGKESKAIIFYEQNDFRIQERLIKSSFPFKDEINTIYNLIANYSKTAIGNLNAKPIRLTKDFYDVLTAKKINEQKFFSALEYFERLGILSRQYPSYLKHYVKFNFAAEKFRDFIPGISSAGHRDIIVYLASKYSENIFQQMTEISIDDLQKFFETTKSEILNKLERFAESGIIDFERPSSSAILQFAIPRFDPEKSSIFSEHPNSAINLSLRKLELMREFLLSKNCRFGFILKYFGESSENYKCGKCDNCKGNIDGQNIIEFISETIMETLGEINSAIDKNDLIEALLGAENRIDLWNIKNFSSLKFYSRGQIQEVIDLLKVKNILAERKNEIRLKRTEKKDETAPDFNIKLGLFNKLREIRLAAASKFSQPEQLICSDEILLDIVETLPENYNQLISINGFNQRMYNKIGEEFLHEIKKFNEQKDTKQKIPKEFESLYNLVSQKYTLSQIANKLRLSESVVSVQIESLIKFYPDTDIKSLVPYEKINMIKKTLEKGITNIKSIRESLNERVSYGEIRIVKAKMKIN